jgi:hypothetical protein
MVGGVQVWKGRWRWLWAVCYSQWLLLLPLALIELRGLMGSNIESRIRPDIPIIRFHTPPAREAYVWGVGEPLASSGVEVWLSRFSIHLVQCIIQFIVRAYEISSTVRVDPLDVPSCLCILPTSSMWIALVEKQLKITAHPTSFAVSMSSSSASGCCFPWTENVVSNVHEWWG